MMEPLDFYGGKKEFEKAKEEKIQEIKHSIKEHLPPPFKGMLDTPEGTYALIAMAVVIFIIFLRIVGITLKFFSKVILILALLAALYFSYLYFSG